MEMNGNGRQSEEKDNAGKPDADMHSTEKYSTDKLRILQVHNFYKLPGGEDVAADNEKKELEQMGHFVYRYSRSNLEMDSFTRIGKLKFPFACIFSMQTYSDVKRIIREQKIQIVHVHNTFPLISPSVFYAAFRMHVPVVMTMHNFRLLCPGAMFYRDGKVCEDCVTKGLQCAAAHGCYRNSRLQSALSATILQIHRWLGTYKRVNFICLTEFNKEKLLSRGEISEARVFVKGNALPVEKTITVVPLEERKEQYLFAGRLEETKGIQVLLKAYGRDQDRVLPMLQVAGDGPLRSWCQEYISKHRLTNVTMLGQIKKEAVTGLLAELKALIQPSLWYEGYPMTMAEAFSCKTPVIGSDCGNVGSLIREGKNGFKFKTGNAEALFRLLQQYAKGECTIEPEKVLLQKDASLQKEDFLQEKISFHENGDAYRLLHIYHQILRREKESCLE